jgi:hypothetical protein
MLPVTIGSIEFDLGRLFNTLRATCLSHIDISRPICFLPKSQCRLNKKNLKS